MKKSKNKLMKTAELKKALKRLPDWSTNPKQTFLYKTYKFANHVEALVFIARITVYAEVQSHHPDIEFSYRKVKVKLTTHEEKGLTKKDINLALQIEKSSRG